MAVDSALPLETDPEDAAQCSICSPCGIVRCDDYGGAPSTQKFFRSHAAEFLSGRARAELFKCDQLCPDCGIEVWANGPPACTVNPQKMKIIWSILLGILTHLLAFWLGGFFCNSDPCLGDMPDDNY